MRPSNWRNAWNGLLLSKTLMRARVIVKAHVLGHETPQVLMAEDQHVVEQFPGERPGESLRESIHVGRADSGRYHAPTA
jgi:hypothetical protein